jgi:type I restriction enzyme S subunit
MNELGTIETDLPDGWEWVIFRDIAQINPRDPEIRNLPDDFMVTFLPMASIDSEKGIVARYEERPLSQVRKGFTSFSDGDVLFAKITPSMENGKAAIAYNLVNGRGFGSTEFHVMSPRDGILSKWLFYFIRQEKFRNDGKANFAGTAGQLRVPADFIRNYPIPLAPLSEQHRIISRIDEIFSRLDAGFEALQRAKAQLQRYRQSVLKAAVEGKLTEEWRKAHPEVEPAEKLLELKNRSKRKMEKPELKISILPEVPNEWQWVNLKDIGIISGGLTKNPNRSNFPLKMPYLRVANVYAGELRLDDVKDIGIEEKELDKVLLKEGDLLVVEGNGSQDQIGRVALWDGSISPCVHQNHIIKARFNSPRIGRFILYWLLSINGRKQISKVASSTSGLYTLSISKIASLMVPLPSLLEQEKIVNEIEYRLSITEAEEKILDLNILNGDRLRQSILKHAFEGKLVPQDPNDEPAKTLLDRIAESMKERDLPKKAKSGKIKPKVDNQMREISLYELLCDSKKSLTPNELLISSNLELEEFYFRLKQEIEKGRIIEDKTNNVLIARE